MNNLEEILTKGITNTIPNRDILLEVLKSGKKLNIYYGVDPTATHIHLGNAIALRKLQSFVELGHNVTFLIGDFTALIGDTSDKETERPILTYRQVKDNFKTYKAQAGKLIDFSKIKIVFNSEWLNKLKPNDVVNLCRHFSLGEFAGRELVAKRLKENKRVGLHEALYPVMQGYDSYYLDADIQIGGPDQTFNMQAGRILQNDVRAKKTYILVTGYLEGTDGRKMSKSWGNAIWLDDTPGDIYSKVMSIKDELLITYFTLATNLSYIDVKEKEKHMKNNENSQNLKIDLAYQIVTELHSTKDAILAKEDFLKKNKLMS